MRHFLKCKAIATTEAQLKLNLVSKETRMSHLACNRRTGSFGSKTGRSKEIGILFTNYVIDAPVCTSFALKLD